jgi:hypothetical protein
MFSRAGIIELHAAMHERLDLLLRHVATVPDNLHHKPIPTLDLSRHVNPSRYRKRIICA